MKAIRFILFTVGLLAPGASAQGDPRITSWLTTYSGGYARIYADDASKLSGVSQTTWTNPTASIIQALPAYRGIQEIATSTDWVYLRSSGLGSHVMGPWYLNAAHTMVFPNVPKNAAVWYRIPRMPTIPAGKTLTAGGPIGYFVDGVAMFDTRDAFAYTSGSGHPGTEANPGGGYWNRDAYVNEGVTFDAALAHSPGNGQYHYHANPPALRYLLGDHVLFNPATKVYSEDTNNVSPAHSPILGWARDGLPVYGPYGYSVTNNAASSVRRMISGFRLRDLNAAGVSNRTTYPLWAVRVKGSLTTNTGPVVAITANANTTRPLGRYLEDNDYLGDLGYTPGVDFDLNEWNARFCVTPEFPGGTWAYFVCINSNGTPAFPYNIGRQFFGNPTGNNVNALAETVVTNYSGGPNTPLTLNPPGTTSTNHTVTLVWSSVEGGTYEVASSTNAIDFTPEISGVESQGLATTTNYTGVDGLQYARVERAGLADYDPVGATADVSQSATQSFTITIGAGPGTNAIPAQAGTYGTTFNFTFATNAFTGLTAPVNYVASGMPAGISFTNATRTFGGKPTQLGAFTVSLVATDSGGPAVTLTNRFSLTVSQAPLTVTAASFSRLQGTTNPTFTASYAGFVNGETLATSDLAGTPSLTTTATAGSPAGSYAITCATGSLTSAHYALAFGNGTLTVTNASGPASGPRNILLIIADDYGADSSSLYNSTANGATFPPTPTIQSLASRAVVFRNAWACPECSPSRASMLTGRYPFRTGIGDAIAGGDAPLSATEYTLPKAFSNSAPNYHLAHFGKWHLAVGAGTVNSPKTTGGWSNYVGCLTGALVSSYSNWTKTSNNVQTTGYTNYATTDLVNDATDWIATRGTNPWFAWVAFNAPHTPLHIPPASLAPGYATNTGVTANRRQFEAMVESMDTELARLLASVDTNNTHIIFLGDNGTPNNILQPPYPATRGKSSLYEGGIKVPFFICGPSVVNPGRTNATPVHLVDVFSTVLELAGINVAATLANSTNAVDSKSLLPILQNQPDVPRYTFSEYYSTNATFAANSGRAIRNAGYKLIRQTNGTELLYHLAADPYEGTNLFPLTTGTAAWSNYNALVLRLPDFQSALSAPTILSNGLSNVVFNLSVARNASLNYALWRAPVLGNDLAWAPVTNATIITNGTTSVILRDTNAVTAPLYYRVMATQP